MIQLTKVYPVQWRQLTEQFCRYWNVRNQLTVNCVWMLLGVHNKEMEESVEPAIRIYNNSSESNVTSCLAHMTMSKAKLEDTLCYFHDIFCSIFTRQNDQAFCGRGLACSVVTAVASENDGRV